VLSDQILSDAHILRARCFFALDKDENARQSFRDAVAVDPGWRPDPVYFTTGEIEQFSMSQSSVPVQEPKLDRSTVAPPPASLPVGDSPGTRKKGFFVGAAGSILLVRGTGDFGGADFSLQDNLLNELEINVEIVNEVGWGWENSLLTGFKPVAGYRVNSRFSVFGAFQYWFEKISDNNYYFDESGFTNYGYEDSGGMWNQRSLQLCMQFYPKLKSGLYLLGGWEFVSATATYTSEWDWGDGISGNSSLDIDLSGNGLIIGAGFDFLTFSSGLTFYGAATYSTASVTSKHF